SSRRGCGGIPAVVAGENIFDRVLLRFLVAQLTRPLHPGLRVGAGAGVLIFAEARGFLRIGLIVPVLPAFGLDVRAEVAMKKCDGGVGAPRPPEQRGGAFVSQLAVEKNEA